MSGVTAEQTLTAWPPGAAAPSAAVSAGGPADQLATGVVVLTCGGEADVQGVTVSTLALASVEPPIVSVALRRGSRGLRVLLGTSAFVVNVLGSGQEGLARHFAHRRRPTGVDQLAPETWAGRTQDGVPVLRDAFGWLLCSVQRTVPVGDHELLLAGVDRSVRGGGAPLLNFAGGLHRLPATTTSERD
ncbi:flavin reductase family protein [Streptomyces sp. NPDC003032]